MPPGKADEKTAAERMKQVALDQPLDFARVMVTVMVMQAPIADVKKRLCELVNRVEQGESIVILRHGRPAARLVPMPGRGRPWRVERPDDPERYRGLDLDEPVLEEI